MIKDKNQKLIDDIVKLSEKSDDELSHKINKFIEIYHIQKKEYEKSVKQTNFFLKKWDKSNILAQERDLQKDKMIEQQSRMAAMGEMIDAVAHQWKQPLNAISMITDLLKTDFKNGEVNQNYIEDVETTIHLQIDHMVNTLNEFRKFLRPATKDESFFIQEVIDNINILLKDELLSQNINIHLSIDKKIKLFGNKNEFKHLFINLINNAIDSFNENKIKARDIYLRCYSENTNIYLEVEDNAGGIKLDIIKDIFKPNTTSKPEGKGTGIGLYMSSQIVKKNNGSINVHNTNDGAFFTIILKQKTL